MLLLLVPFARSDIEMVKSDTKRFRNVYSCHAVRAGRTVDPTWSVDLLDCEIIIFRHLD